MATNAPRLSVIVPLAPGETEGRDLLAQLIALPAGSEVIVAHADEACWPVPPGWPARLDYRPCRCAPGRARQQNLGATQARGRWLWFLHADSRFTAETLPALEDFLARDIDALGWFRLAFRRDGPRRTALNALGANLRARWLGLPFGDQGLLLPRERFFALGGFDEQARYGEDHLLVWAARRVGLPLHGLPATLETSARKYARHGWLVTTLRHGRLTIAQAWPAWRALRKVRS